MVLHAVDPRRQRVEGARDHRATVALVHPRGLEHLAHDGGHREVLEDATVDALREGPERGHDDDADVAVRGGGAEVFDAPHDALHLARAVTALDLHDRVGPEEPVGLRAGRRQREDEGAFIRLREGLAESREDHLPGLPVGPRELQRHLRENRVLKYVQNVHRRH